MIKIERLLLPLTSILAFLLCCGCRERSAEPSPPSAVETRAASSSESQPPQPVDHLAAAQRLLRIRDWESAAQSAYKALLEDPDNDDAKLIAAAAESERGKPELAIDLAASIDPQSRLGEKAVQLHAQLLVASNQTSRAADVLLAAIEVAPYVEQWRHQAWSLLNRVGRRQEASDQAIALCRTGLASEQELLSLISRWQSFPTPGMLLEEGDGDQRFASGLGMARWYFSQQDHRRALDELDGEREVGFSTPAAAALYGRLLGETQQWDEFRDWSLDAPDTTKRFADYWAALGNFFIDHQRYEAAARALLEAVQLDPTDRISVQRLAKVFDALGRPQDGEQFRRRGIDIAATERSASAMRPPTRDEAQKRLMRQVMELGRPFETLAWTRLVVPADATAYRASIDRQRAGLLRDKDALVMASESSLMEIDPNEFSFEPAFEELLSGEKSVLPIVRSREVESLAQPRLVDVAHQVGLDFQWYQDLEINIASIPIHESVGGGIAVIDYDLDGWPDVYLAQGSGQPPTDACTRSNVLMRNLNSRFHEVTQLAEVVDFNYGAGLAAGDVNQDGFADLFVGSLGHNRLLINNGDGTFRDGTSSLAPGSDRFTSSLAIADINGDALPDLFEGIYIEMEGAFEPPKIGEDGYEVQPSPLEHFAQSDRWYQNMGDGSFQLHEITSEVARPGTTLGLIVTDFDGDGRNEVFAGNDVRPNHFLIQSGDNQFLNAADAKGVANGFSGAANGCMGIATGDFNGDGRLDMHIANFSHESNNLYVQNSAGGFTDLAIRYGIDQISLPYVGFGTKAADIDRNGWLDLIVTNGHIFDMRRFGEGFQMPPQFLVGRGNRFELISVDDDSGYWDGEYLGRAMAMFDFDRDGAIDFLIGHLDRPLALLHNQTKTEGKRLQFELVGTASERDAIGARVVVAAGGQQQTMWVIAGDGYYCSDEPMLDFGMGTSGAATRIDVHWPSGQQQTFDQPVSAGRYLIMEGESELYAR